MTDNHNYAQLCRFFTDKGVEGMDGLGSRGFWGDADCAVVLQAGADLLSRARDICRHN
jgi:phage gp46-like protein